MRKAFATVALLSLAGCQSIPTPLPGSSPLQLTEADIAAVQEGVKNELLDPYSAVFYEMKASTLREGSIKVCSLVNAKNRLGGYIGKSFYVGELRSGIFKLEKLASNEVQDTIVWKKCVLYGVYPPG